MSWYVARTGRRVDGALLEDHATRGIFDESTDRELHALCSAIYMGKRSNRRLAASDAIQEMKIACWQAMKSWAPSKGSMYSYLTRVCTNEIWSMMRNNSRMKRRHDVVDIDDAGNTVSDVRATYIWQESLGNAGRPLHAERRTVYRPGVVERMVRMRDRGRSWRQISKVFRITPEKVRDALHRHRHGNRS